MSVILTSQPADGVTMLTLNRPDHLNAMTAELIQGLHDALDAVAADHACRVVILTGAGRGFCAGLDLRGYGTVPGTEGAGLGRTQGGLRVQKHIASLVPHLRATPQPVIAAVNGPATGGGLALVMGSDIRLAAPTARFNAAFVRVGLSACDIGTSWLLPRLVGMGRAQELMLTGRLIGAEEAAAIGLVLEVVADGDVVGRALAKAEEITRNSPFGVTLTKETLWSSMEIPGLQAAIDLENRTQILASATEDHVEALRAFLEKRDPVFRNR